MIIKYRAKPTKANAWSTNGVLADEVDPTEVDARSTNGTLEADCANPAIQTPGQCILLHVDKVPETLRVKTADCPMRINVQSSAADDVVARCTPIQSTLA